MHKLTTLYHFHPHAWTHLDSYLPSLTDPSALSISIAQNRPYRQLVAVTFTVTVACVFILYVFICILSAA